MKKRELIRRWGILFLSFSLITGTASVPSYTVTAADAGSYGTDSGEIAPEPEPEPEPEPDPEPVPEPEPEPEIEVISYETVTTEDGGQMDVAVVSANGQAVMIADVNQDGVADVMASDLNNNGQLDEGEIVDVSGQNIAMQPLQEAANAGTENLYAQTNDVDYINDANVDDYMA